VFVDSNGDSEVMCVRYNPDGRLLAAGYADGYVKVALNYAARSVEREVFCFTRDVSSFFVSPL